MKHLLVLKNGIEIAIIEIECNGEYAMRPLSDEYADSVKNFKEKVKVTRKSLGLPPNRVTEEEISQNIFRFYVSDNSYLVGNFFEY